MVVSDGTDTAGTAPAKEAEMNPTSIREWRIGGGGSVVPLVPRSTPTILAVAAVILPATAWAQNGEETLATGTWLSLLPPVVAIALALLTRRVIPSLFAGLWVGAWFAWDLSITGIWHGLLSALDTWIIDALTDPYNMAIIVFTMLIAGMVGIISHNGGIKAIVDHIVSWAHTRRRGNVASGAVGTAIFFDDYSSMLVHGNAVRPMTDRLKISRAKLAYVVDTCAAPLATVMLVSTWVGFQVGLIGDATDQLEGYEIAAYGAFLNALPYMFYPLLAFIFMWLVIGTGRDFGPMAKAERQAANGGSLNYGDEIVDEAGDGGDDDLAAKKDIPLRTINAWLPVLVLVVATITGLFVTGEGDNLPDVIGSADPFNTLLWGSLLAVLVAAVLSVSQGILSMQETVGAWFAGVRGVLEVLVILTFAWALSDVTQELDTAAFLAGVLGEAIPPGLMPAIIFVLAAAMSFAIGTSWGTMGILLPLAVPLTWTILQQAGMGDASGYAILHGTIAAVLAGAVWGDHASPISDTTVLSSATSRCGVAEHTNTQLPYALAVGLIAIMLGLLPVGLGLPVWLGLILGLVGIVALVWLVGRPIDDESAPATGGGTG